MTATTKPPISKGILTGASFLMAVSAIGPGFLTQTTLFTVALGASLAFAILLSTIIDIGAQLTTWRVIGVSRKRGHEVADTVLPGLGYVVTAVIVVGSFLFNIGNLGGCALGLEALFGLSQSVGIVLSGLVAVGLFLLPRMLSGMDWFAKLLGVGMIALTFYIVIMTRPPLGEAAYRAVLPERINAGMMITFIGGTIGGYIMFSGAHRLLDGGVGGREDVPLITRAAVQGIIITAIMRGVLFLAALGVVAAGSAIGTSRPVFDAFRAGAGEVGFVLSGLVFWAAAITSVVGCAYTSITFLQRAENQQRKPGWIVGFIVLGVVTTLVLRQLGAEATPVLIFAGKCNGLFLPLLLGIMLLAARRSALMGDYRMSPWVTAFGITAWVATLGMALWTLYEMLS